MGFHLWYANSSEMDHGLMIAQRPTIPTPKERITVSEVPGREYDFSERSGTYEDISIKVPFNYVSVGPFDPSLDTTYRGAVVWLRKKGNLAFSDEANMFRKVRYVDIGEKTTELKRIASFTATFVCLPGLYLTDGDMFHDVESGTELYNYTSYSRPVYEIKGSGECALTVNGNTMRANVDETLIIDTELLIAYKSKEELANASITGDYEDLLMRHGKNEITITDGFTLRMRPNWRVL